MTRFSAIVLGQSPRGHIIMRYVQGPAGQQEQHVWISRRDWKSEPPAAHTYIEFLAVPMPYWRDDGSKDFGLVACRVVGDVQT